MTSERDVLLATKLHMPRPRPDLVPRPRLAERLDEGLARGLMLVCAPAGYGKTVLLADWARRGQQPVAWLSLDVGDNDPARSWRHLVGALDQGQSSPALQPVGEGLDPIVDAGLAEIGGAAGGVWGLRSGWGAGAGRAAALPGTGTRNPGPRGRGAPRARP